MPEKKLKEIYDMMKALDEKDLIVMKTAIDVLSARQAVEKEEESKNENS